MFSTPLLDINKPLTNSILYPISQTPSKSGCPSVLPFLLAQKNGMRPILHYIIALLLFPLAAYPQGNNAVNITIIGSATYSARLADFYSTANEGMLTVVLRNQDIKEPVIPVQLYMSVTNLGDTYILTKSPNTTQPINLKSGETVAITGSDLARLFNTAYLTYKGTDLRDGTNTLKIYARDIRTGKVVSNTASISLRSVVIAPPKLVAPDNRTIIENDNQFLLFRWQGDNGGYHTALKSNYTYIFQLWKQNSTDPNVEIQRTPDFTFDLRTEQYQMILTQFPFEIGQKYCWRVKADDPAKRATILNDGLSEVRSFTYKHLPVPVTGLTHYVNSRTRQATATWNSAEGHTKYYIEYYNPQTGKTMARDTDVPKFTLASAPDEEYRILFRVKAQCWNDDSRCSAFTPWDTIKYAAPQPVDSKYACGQKFPHVEITNHDLKTEFVEGEIVSEANGSTDYEIINCKASADGTLTGQFYMIMNAWGGAKIACEFWDTKINTDNQVIATSFQSLDLPGGVIEPDEIARFVKESWLDGNSLATSSKIRDTIVIKEKFDYLYRTENGGYVAVVVNPDGTTTETEVTSMSRRPGQTLVSDGQGGETVIDRNGQPMGVKEYRATGGNRALLKEYHRKSDSLAQWQINFLPYDHQTYAFDCLGSGNHGIFATDQYYPKSGGYDFRYKSVECFKSDRVVVDFGSYPEKDSVIFKDKYGVTLKLADNNVLSFTGVSTADTNYIYAYRGDKKIGKLFLNTYQRKTYKVVLVSVNDATLPNTSTLGDYLNKVYRQCVDSFEITTDKIKIDDLKSFSHGGSGVLTVYNDDQKKVLKAYDSKMQDNTYYLFFVDGVTNKKDGNGTPVSGYMPRGYNAGFIYDGGSERTIAHELGHGIAGLEHVFENSNNSGKTNNLMDYSIPETATELWHFQWDQIQDPGRVWMKWNKDESEGENVEGIEALAFPNEDCKTVYYLFSAYNSQVLRYYLEMGDKEKARYYLNLWARTEFSQDDFRRNLYEGLIDKSDDKDYNAKLEIFRKEFKDYQKIVKEYENYNGKTDDIAVYYIWGFSNTNSLEELRNHNFAKIYEPYYIDRW